MATLGELLMLSSPSPLHPGPPNVPGSCSTPVTFSSGRVVAVFTRTIKTVTLPTSKRGILTGVLFPSRSPLFRLSLALVTRYDSNSPYRPECRADAFSSHWLRCLCSACLPCSPAPLTGILHAGVTGCPEARRLHNRAHRRTVSTSYSLRYFELLTRIFSLTVYAHRYR